MRRTTIWVLLVVAFGWMGTAMAVKPADTDKPFIYITTTPEKVDLGIAPWIGPNEVTGALTVNVEANCLHGPIYLSATSLSHRNGSSIEPDRIFVRTEATSGFIAAKRPVAISEPTKGPHKIVVDVKVDTPAKVPAGEYNGELALMIVPPL